MIGCSGSHKDSKPSDSALCAMTATSIDRLESDIFTPIFMVSSVYYHCGSRIGVDPPRQTGCCDAAHGQLPRHTGGAHCGTQYPCAAPRSARRAQSVLLA